MKNFLIMIHTIFRPYHLAHAVYTVMVIALYGLITGHYFGGWLFMIGGYLFREVTWTELKRPHLVSYNPMNWSAHDRIQTVYVIVLGGIAVYIGETIHDNLINILDRI